MREMVNATVPACKTARAGEHRKDELAACKTAPAAEYGTDHAAACKTAPAAECRKADGAACRTAHAAAHRSIDPAARNSWESGQPQSDWQRCRMPEQPVRCASWMIPFLGVKPLALQS